VTWRLRNGAVLTRFSAPCMENGFFECCAIPSTWRWSRSSASNKTVLVSVEAGKVAVTYTGIGRWGFLDSSQWSDGLLDRRRRPSLFGANSIGQKGCSGCVRCRVVTKFLASENAGRLGARRRETCKAPRSVRIRIFIHHQACSSFKRLATWSSSSQGYVLAHTLSLTAAGRGLLNARLRPQELDWRSGSTCEFQQVGEGEFAGVGSR
jgi:hypothetical protein